MLNHCARAQQACVTRAERASERTCVRQPQRERASGVLTGKRNTDMIAGFVLSVQVNDFYIVFDV